MKSRVLSGITCRHKNLDFMQGPQKTNEIKWNGGYSPFQNYCGKSLEGQEETVQCTQDTTTVHLNLEFPIIILGSSNLHSQYMQPQMIFLGGRHTQLESSHTYSFEFKGITLVYTSVSETRIRWLILEANTSTNC